MTCNHKRHVTCLKIVLLSHHVIYLAPFIRSTACIHISCCLILKDLNTAFAKVMYICKKQMHSLIIS